MSQTGFSSTDAYRAFTLAERIASARANKRAFTGPIDKELAQRRLHARKLHEPFSSDDFLSRWLSAHEITEEEFFFLLGELPETLPPNLPGSPSWMQALSDAGRVNEQRVPDSLRGVFTEVVWPSIFLGIRKLETAVAVLEKSCTELPFDPLTVENLFLPGLAARLRSLIKRTLVLELNVARLQNLLVGETPEDRFRSFLDRMRDPSALVGLYREYPVLARHVVLAVEQWTSSSIELLQHLCQDSTLIAAQLKLQHGLGRLCKLALSTGDRHRGGRSVAILSFDSGLQLVHKPKSLAMDLHFQQLLRWINGRIGKEEFKTFEAVDCDTHGWVEFVPFRSCTSREEIQRFYERLGGHLALLYALEANDFHSENIIAAGEHPFLIDLECLFQPRMPTDSEPRTQSYFGLSDTAMRVGILPNRPWSDDEAGLEVSGLGGASGQLTPKDMPAWKDAGTDTMRLERQRLAIAGSQNQPTLNGEPVDVFDYAESITGGFARMYRLLMAAREDLLSMQGPLSVFLNDEVRVLFRPTRTYVRLFYESFHPDVLRDELDRECLLDRLWQGIDGQPYLARIVPAELKALQNQDVPLFAARVSSLDLWSSDGERFPDFLEKPAIHCVRERLQQLNESDLTRQLWFVRSSLATLTVAADQARWPAYTPVEPSEPVTSSQLLRAACAIGDRLESIALREANEATWVGLAFANEGHWVLRPLNPEFYSGLSGIILFLATLGEVAHESRYQQLARAALAMVNRQLEESQDSLTSIGAYTGWGGLIYCYAHLGALWKEEYWLSQALRFAERIPPLIAKDAALDVTGGSAGCIATLLCLNRCVPDTGLLELAGQCGDRLIHAAVPLGDGMIGWPSPVAGARPLAGFSHGAGGCSWALLQLFAMTGRECYRSAALQAIQYERSLYSPEAGNWRDLRGLNRANPDPNQFRVAWCHGAAGIGLARLTSLRFLDAAAEGEIDMALKTTLDRGFGTNHSLCHGDLGNLDLLLQAAEALGGPWKKEADRVAGIIMESIRQHGWLCGVPLGVESPGLMTGLAGIGYGLLRAAFPDRVASVLTLDAPKT